MARTSSGTRSQLIHCDNCGEEYSATYKRCPFCGARPDNGGMDLTSRITGLAGGKRAADSREDARSSRSSRSRSQSREEEEYEDDYVFDGGDVFDDEDDDYDDDEEYYARRGGKRLLDGGISPTTIAGIAFSAVLFIAAILIVALVIVPMVRDGSTEPATNEPNGSLPGTSNSESPSLPASPLPSVPDGEDPNGPTTTAPVDDPNGTSTPIPAGQTATGFTIGKSEFTISDTYPAPVTIKVTFSPAGTTGTITWSSSNANVATVDSNGKVTGVGKGTCTITASMPGAVDRTCLVRVTISGGGSASPSSSSPAASDSPSSGSLSLKPNDFSISDAYPNPVTITASGGSGTITWSSNKPEVATVDAGGKVTRVGKGTATITATDSEGKTATCIVRCS